MRPIWVTNLTMMAGAATILFDPIFQGMAISLLFGPVVATTLTLFVIPLGCTSVRNKLCPSDDSAEAAACLISVALDEDSDDICYQQLVIAIIDEKSILPTIKSVMSYEFNGKTLSRSEARKHLDKMVEGGVLQQDKRNRYQIIAK